MKLLVMQFSLSFNHRKLDVWEGETEVDGKLIGVLAVFKLRNQLHACVCVYCCTDVCVYVCMCVCIYA
jgi:hypothetical protein